MSTSVATVMHQGVVGVSPDASLRLVAQIMAEQRVHALVVRDEGSEPVGLVSSLDVVSAVAQGLDPTAGQMAGGEPVTVSADDAIDHAAQLMQEHETEHLLVCERGGTAAVGIVSTIDVARFYGR